MSRAIALCSRRWYRKFPMRNIIICCDGTGNEIGENISNVLKQE
jgi:uncharacterized protein (DUF2235 family)